MTNHAETARTASTHPGITRPAPPCRNWPNDDRHFRDQQPLARRPEGAARALRMCLVLKPHANSALISLAGVKKDDPGLLKGILNSI